MGGGHHATTQIRLLVDGKVVCATSGKDNEQLLPATWDVGAFQGQKAHIEIVDEQKGGWGHINVDQIEFTDMPGNRAVMQVLEELLPARFSRVRPAGDAGGGSKAVEFENLVLLPDAAQSKASDGTTLLTRPVGKGKVVLAAGPVLEPATRDSATSGSLPTRSSASWWARLTPGPAGNQHPKAPGFGTLALAALKGEMTVLPGCQGVGRGVEGICR